MSPFIKACLYIPVWLFAKTLSTTCSKLKPPQKKPNNFRTCLCRFFKQRRQRRRLILRSEKYPVEVKNNSANQSIQTLSSYGNLQVSTTNLLFTCLDVGAQLLLWAFDCGSVTLSRLVSVPLQFTNGKKPFGSTADSNLRTIWSINSSWRGGCRVLKQTHDSLLSIFTSIFIFVGHLFLSSLRGKLMYDRLLPPCLSLIF